MSVPSPFHRTNPLNHLPFRRHRFSAVLLALASAGLPMHAQEYDLSEVTRLAEGALVGKNVGHPVSGFEIRIGHGGTTFTNSPDMRRQASAAGPVEGSSPVDAGQGTLTKTEVSPSTQLRQTVSGGARTPSLLPFSLASASQLAAQTYDFSAATAQLQSNLAVYGGRVVVIVEQQRLGEIFRFEAGPLTQDSKIGIASCTKWLSGAIVLACAERGYFALDDRVGDYLPIFDPYGKGDITLRQCFGMKSGLSLKDPDYETDSTLTLAASADLIAAKAPIVFPPGTQLDYEGDGMQTVGRICEVVTGKSWSTLASELLFDPLGMSSADYLAFDPNPGIAGGARCTATDYLKFLRMVLNNGQGENGRVVLSSRSVQEFFTNQTFGLPEYSSPAQNSDYYAYDERPDYGMGSWVIAQNPGSGVVEEVASPGAFGTYPWVDRKRGLRGIVFMLRIGATAIENNLRVLAHIRTEIDAKGLPPAEAPGALSLGVADQYLRLAWPGGGTLETSPDLSSWTVLPWASSPFLESLTRPPGPQLFYRVRR